MSDTQQSEPKALHLIGLQVDNVMRLRAVKINPANGLVVIGGQNTNGKTSLLNSIAMLIRGGAEIPAEPIHHGEKKAQIIGDFGEFNVTRSFTEKGTTLTVAAKAGAKLSSPQAVLDKFTSTVAFDPVSFLKCKPEEQLSILKRISGVDLSDIEKRRGDIAGLLQDLRKDLKRVSAAYDLVPSVPEGTPKEEADPADLARRVAEYDQIDEKLNEVQVNGQSAATLVTEKEAELAKVQKQLEDARANHKRLQEQWAELDERRKSEDGEELRKQLNSISATNSNVRRKREKIKLGEEVAATEAKMKELSDENANLVATREQRLTAAKFPIPGLGFDDTGILFNGKPFAQASSAQRIRTSVAMGMALSPELRIMIVRDGSDLDATNLSLVAEMAAENNFQVFMERVSEGEECSFIIEDGEVAVEQEPVIKSRKGAKPLVLKK